MLKNPPYEGLVNVPDPAVLRQGGDNILGAVTVTPSSIPFTDVGTTSGYTNDYDEVCPYDGSTAPDVVYRFTPLIDTFLTISLCGDATDYDTKLYAYAWPDTTLVIACNDDFCTTYFGQPYVSQLDCMPVSTGVPYYFVVDGYGVEFGNYEISFD